MYIDNSGYYNVYIDGVLSRRSEVAVSDQASTTTDYASYIELRANRPTTTNTYRFDDIYIADYPTVKPEYTATVSMPEYNDGLSVNGETVGESGAQISVTSGGSVNFEVNNIEKKISTIEKVDYLGFHNETYTVNAKTYTISDADDDAVYEVNFTDDEDLVKTENEIFYEDFKGTAAEDPGTASMSEVGTTNRGRRLRVTKGTNYSYDAENGYFTYAKTNGKNAYFNIKNADSQKLFTYYLGRSYRYDFNVKAATAKDQQMYLQTASQINGAQWAGNIDPTFNNTEFQTITSTIKITSLSDDNGATWTGKSKNINSLESVSFSTDSRTFSEIKVTEIKYSFPVTLTQTGNGTVTYTEADNTAITMAEGSNNVEVGERTFTVTPAEGYTVKAVDFGGTAIPVTNEDGFTATVTVNAKSTINVTFAEKTKTAPTVTTGTPVVAANYQYSSTSTPSNTIVGYATIDTGYGSTVSGCGYYITDNGGNKLTLPAVSLPKGTTYGIRMFGEALVSGTYKIQPYITLSDDSVIIGDEKTVTIE